MLLSRYKLEDYTTLRGIQTITSIPRYKMWMLPLKELCDNAADEVERKSNPEIKLNLEVDRFTIEDNGGGISRDKIDSIFDWEKFTSSKYYIFKPTRGALGCGLSLTALYISALSNEYGNRSAGHVKIRSADYEFTVSSIYFSGGKIVDERTMVDAPFRQGTMVEVKFPAPILDLEKCYEFLDSYILLNPWLNFKLNGSQYPAVTKFNINKRSYASYYMMGEFMELMFKAAEEYPDYGTNDFLYEHFATPITYIPIESKKLCMLTREDIKNLYEALLTVEEKTGGCFIGFIGRKPIAKRLKQLRGEFERLVYHHVRWGPVVYETWCAHGAGYEFKFITGINNTIPYENPLLKYYLTINANSIENKDNGQIHLTLPELLRRCGIKETEPVTTLFHMFDPKPMYGSYAKTSIILDSTKCEVAGNILHETCKWYAGHKGQDCAFKIDKERLKMELVKLVNKYHSAGYKISTRHVYYRAAPLNLYPFNRKGYRIVCDMLLECRMKGLLPWESIADRSRYWIDPLPKYTTISEMIDEFNGIIMSKLGFNPWKRLGTYIEIWVEKDSIAEFLKPIAYKWLVVIAPSRGYSSWSYAWEGVKRIRDYGFSNNVILYLGDFDPSGLDIENHLRHAINYFGVNCEIRRIAIKESDVKNLPPSPLKKTDPRLRRKYRDYIEKYGTNVWEIDALEPADLYARIEQELRILVNMDEWNKIISRNEVLKHHATELLEEIIRKISNSGMDY